MIIVSIVLDGLKKQHIVGLNNS